LATPRSRWRSRLRRIRLVSRFRLTGAARAERERTRHDESHHLSTHGSSLRLQEQRTYPIGADQRTGYWRLGTGYRLPATGNRQPATGNGLLDHQHADPHARSGARLRDELARTPPGPDLGPVDVRLRLGPQRAFMDVVQGDEAAGTDERTVHLHVSLDPCVGVVAVHVEQVYRCVAERVSDALERRR